MIQFDHHVKVYYKDIDQMGIVYYSRYFEFFEEARTELLDSIELDVTTIENAGIQLPVITSHCDYKKGAIFEQDLNIQTSILEIPRAKLKIDYCIYSKTPSQLLAKGYTVHAFIKESGQPIKVPNFILQKMKKHF